MKKLAMLFFGAFVLSSTLQAGTYDFTAEGNALEFGYNSFKTGLANDSHVAMPSDLTITASNVTGSAAAYFDADFNGPGGLGVCSAGAGLACDGTGDDNQTSSNGETIHMVWDAIIELVSIKIIGNHVAVVPLDLNGAAPAFVWKTDNESGSFGINGANETLFDLSLITTATKTFEYYVTNSEIYVMSLTTVPVPAAVWLFGTAMLGLFGMRRKAKMGAVAA
jgi:hypothetical protein